MTDEMNEVNAVSATASTAKTATAKVAKWTDEQVATLETGYVKGDVASVEALMAELGKTKRQVVGKLVAMKLYEKPAEPVKQAKVEGPSKKELLADLRALGFDDEGLQGATKDAIVRVLEAVSKVNASE